MTISGSVNIRNSKFKQKIETWNLSISAFDFDKTVLDGTVLLFFSPPSLTNFSNVAAFNPMTSTYGI